MKGKALKYINIQDIHAGLKVISPMEFYDFFNILTEDLVGEVVFVKDLGENSYIIIEITSNPLAIMHIDCWQWFLDDEKT